MSKIIGVTVGTPVSSAKIKLDIEPEIKEYIDNEIGDVEAALNELRADVEALKIVDSPLPIEVATEKEMTDILATEDVEVGSVYKYTGKTTDNYVNGELYIVEEVTE